jgi:hypothetical protein
MSPFEAGMIVSFGASWPVAIRKTLQTRSVQGKSGTFLLLVLAGYGLGILHKLLFSRDVVVLLYAFNFAMVAIELLLWLRYHDGRSLADVRPERGEELAPRSHPEPPEDARDLVRDGALGAAAPPRDLAVRAAGEDRGEDLALGVRALCERFRGRLRDDDEDVLPRLGVELVERRAGGR